MSTDTTRTALITGASRGLGLALARRLAALGWTLIIDARGAERLEVARAELVGVTSVHALSGDVVDAQHRATLADTARELGGLDAVINNASILGPSPQPPLLDYPLDMLEGVYRTNVLAPLALLQAVQHALKPGAKIINVSSDAGVEAYPGWGGYGSSKAALEHLSAILAAERPDLRVYWVDPGDMQTDMHQAAFPDEDISDRPLPETSVPGVVALLDRDYPSGRYVARTLGDNKTSAAGVQELRVSLTVADFDAAVDLYRDGLGLPLVNDWTSAEGRCILLGAGRATLELIDQHQADLIDRIEVGERVAGPVRLAFEVANVERTSVALREAGAVVVNVPVQTPWNNFNQRLQAPDGMQLTLFQPITDVARDEIISTDA